MLDNLLIGFLVLFSQLLPAFRNPFRGIARKARSRSEGL